MSWLTSAGLRDEANDSVVRATFTISFTRDDPLRSNSWDPSYTALIGWVPAGSVEVENAVLPPANSALPNSVVPSKNSTVPVGTPEEELTVEVKVMVWPKIDGSSDEATVVTVGLWGP